MTQSSAARRVIDWDALTDNASSLSSERRAIVGGTWRERMREEHLAVGAFSLLVQELAEQGCEPPVLSLAARAVADEVRHGEVCGRMTEAILGPGSAPRVWRGLPKVPVHEEFEAKTRVLLHVVEMCCLNETLTGVFFVEMRARASDGAARLAVESLLEDEIDHGRVGWAYLATRAREGTLDGLRDALPAMIDRTIGRALRPAREVSDDDSMEAFGYVREAACAPIVRRALRDVVVPGFETLGIDLSPSRDLLKALLCA